LISLNIEEWLYNTTKDLILEVLGGNKEKKKAGFMQDIMAGIFKSVNTFQ